jgi:hypothetical protein
MAGNLTSDAGLLLLSVADRKTGVTDAIAGSSRDTRQAGLFFLLCTGILLIRKRFPAL